MKRILILVIAAAIVMSSCKEKDPYEGVPAFIRVDEAVVDIIDPSQGTAMHGVTDCWLSAGSTKVSTIGVFEIPFEVPVLASGNVRIDIEPGIKQSGLDAKRNVYPMLTNYSIDTVLTPNTTLKLTPHYSYRQGVNFVLMENFDQIGSKFEKSDSSTYDFVVANGEGFDGYAMKVVIPKDEYSGYFECRSSDVYSLSEKGETFLEISYKCNDKFNFGMFGLVESATSTKGVRENVYTFYPTDGKGKRVYINLNSPIINSASNCGQFQPFFTAVRVDSLSPVGQNTEIFIDNVKLLHLEN
jgi:hypothetical protein